MSNPPGKYAFSCQNSNSVFLEVPLLQVCQLTLFAPCCLIITFTIWPNPSPHYRVSLPSKCTFAHHGTWTENCSLGPYQSTGAGPLCQKGLKPASVLIVGAQTTTQMFFYGLSIYRSAEDFHKGL